MSRIARVFGLRPGEGRSVGLAVTTSFFASAGLMIGGSGIEALFFARYGVSKLPVMYLVLGATMFLLTVGFGALLGRVGRGRACLLIPIALAVIAAVGQGRAGGRRRRGSRRHCGCCREPRSSWWRCRSGGWPAS